jgi:hypothetical protein
LLKHFCLPACLCGILLWLLPFSSYSGEYSAEVKQVEITLQGDSYMLSAVIVYELSENAKEALQNGVPLFWDIHIKILQHRDFLWDRVLVDTVIRYRIQYHALLNMYRVRNEVKGEVYNFSTLSAALDLMSTVSNFRLMKKVELASDKRYLCAMRVNFDREALPLPLRPMAYIDPQWYLSSDWTLWPLKK